jgi:moderate conductance mechanosensitive channel
MDTTFSLQGIDFNKLFDATIKGLLGPGVRVVLILIFAWAAIRLGRIFIRRTVALALRETHKNAISDAQTAKRRTTLDGLFSAILRVSIYTVSALMIFKELNFEIGPILASAGILGLAIGIGAQNLVKDIITGAFIVLEQQFSVGDVGRIGDRSGAVEYVGLRTTILRDQEGTAHIIPNGKIETVSVMTKGWSQFVLDIDVTSETDVERVITTIEKVLDDYAREFPENVLGDPQVLGIESFGDNSVKIRSVVKTAPSKQWDAGRVIRRKIKAEFDRLGIEIPIKQRVVLLYKQDNLAPTESASPQESHAGRV